MHFADKVDTVLGGDTCLVTNPPPENMFGTLRGRMPRGVPKSTKLKVEVTVTFTNGQSQALEALIDTGAEAGCP